MDVSDFVLVLDAVLFGAVLAFIVTFLLEPWHKTLFGKSLMATAVGVLLLSFSTIAYIMFGPDFKGQAELHIFATLVVLYAIGAWLFELFKARREYNKKKDIE